MNNNIIERGDVYWYTPPKIVSTSIQQKMRPVIITSNNICNEKSTILSGRYTTTSKKTYMPTHVHVYIGNTDNIILCEQDVPVVKERLESYIGTVDDFTMHQIERAILIQQNIDSSNHIDRMNYLLQDRYIEYPYSNSEPSVKKQFCDYREEFGAKKTCMRYNLDISTVDDIYLKICKEIEREPIELPKTWKLYISNTYNKFIS